MEEFDWMAWGAEARRYVDEPRELETADLDTIQKLITTHVRSDRFSEGHLRSMTVDGHIARILRRLETLTDTSTGGLRACIHRGSDQIGGTCVELECEGSRLVLDIGVPLDAKDPSAVTMPEIPGLHESDPSLLGIVISHPHQDHYGLASRVPKGTQFLMGAASERILAASAAFTPSGGSFENVLHLEDGKPINLGPFQITPFLMDHSAYDAYAILVEAAGKQLFYSGDLRAHGRKGQLFEKLLSDPPTGVDVLLMEGTTVTRAGTDHGFRTESELEEEVLRLFNATVGMPLVWCSGQNIDRLVTVFRAAKRAGRQFIMDMYTAHILAATENSSLPQSHWKETKVFLP